MRFLGLVFLLSLVSHNSFAFNFFGGDKKLCEMIIPTADYTQNQFSQDQIDKKISHSGNLKNATCVSGDYTPPQPVPILFYAVSRGISNEDYGADGRSASIETLEKLVLQGADTNLSDGGAPSCSLVLDLTLNQPDLALFLLQHGAKPCDSTLQKEISVYGTTASLPVLTGLIDAGGGKPNLILNTLQTEDDANWVATANALAQKYPGVLLFDEDAAYGALSSQDYEENEAYPINTIFPGKLNWLIAHGLSFTVTSPGRTDSAFDSLLRTMTVDQTDLIKTIATAANITITATDLAAAAGNRSNADTIFNYVLANLPLDKSLTGTSNVALNLAITSGLSVTTLKTLLSAKPDLSIEAATEPATTLSLAAGIATTDVLQALIDGGANVTQVSSVGHETAFMAAVEKPNETNAVFLLTASQSVINQQNSAGLSALMIAAKNGNSDLVALISGVPGVNIEAKDPNGNTALYYAIDSGMNSGSAALELLSHGACVKTKNTNGETALDHLNQSTNYYYYGQSLQAIKSALQIYMNQADHC